MAGFVTFLAENLGSEEDAIRLLLSLFAGYPLAMVHRRFLYGRPAHHQHLYFVLCGLVLGYFNFGNQVVHSFANVVLIFLLLQLVGATAMSVTVAFIFNNLYLCFGYYHTMTENYSIKWTMAQCVLTLRLTGLVYDVYDGRSKPEHLSAAQKESALKTPPSLLEMLGHTYFYGGFLVGPQFSMKRYQDFVKGAFSDSVTGGPPASITPGLMRLAAGIAYTITYQLGAYYLPDSYLLSEDFQVLALWKKCLTVGLWGKLTVHKYVACWLITEGSCILSGLTYNGKDENGNDLWDSCANIDITKFEMTDVGQSWVPAFNINTNKWMAQYVFKRLKFLGNKNLSQGITLFYLALWHGLYSGYFMNFLLEFLIINFEKLITPGLVLSWPVKALYSLPAGNAIAFCLKKVYGHIVVGYALVSFTFYTYERYLSVYWSMYFIVHVVTIGTAIAFPLLLKPKRTSSKQNGEQHVKQQ